MTPWDVFFYAIAAVFGIFGGLVLLPILVAVIVLIFGLVVGAISWIVEKVST